MLKKIITILSVALLSTFGIFAGDPNDISVEQLPPEVKSVLEKYVSILRSAATVDECAKNLVEIAGGGLVNEDGSLRKDVPQFSLKKDFTDIKQYADPIVITRVNLTSSNGDGFGKTKIKGKIYKIWIDKKDKSLGMPAPVRIMIPEGHPTITTPKVVQIGNY